MEKNPLKITIFVIFCSYFVLSCTFQYKNCEISPDLEKISESAQENIENLSETELMSGNATCTF